MRTSLAFAIASTILLAPIAAGIPGDPAEPGLRRACDTSDNENPCRWIIPQTQVMTGESRTYRGSYLAIGTVVIHAGGEVVVVDSNIKFENTSAGFVVEPGGALSFENSTLLESPQTLSDFQLVAQPASTFSLITTTVTGGLGVRVATESATMSGNTLSSIPLALGLQDVSITVEGNTFLDNTVAVNETGGAPTLRNNLFSGGEICVRDWRTDPFIIDNVFHDCHIGIWHEQSESVFEGNVMDDQAVPPGAGIVVKDTMSPTIRGNSIRDFGTGILIINARAYIRENLIENNVRDGIRVESNAAPMDIANNVIRLNGGDGIHLERVADLPVTGNTIEQNGGDGIEVANSTGASVTGNTVTGNAGAGIRLTAAPQATLADNVVSQNGEDGIHVDASSTAAIIERAQAIGNGGDGIDVRASGASIVDGLAQGNGGASAGHGLRVQGASGVRVEGLASLANAGDGVFLGASTTTLLRVNASQNARNGFAYDPMGPLALLGETELTLVRAMGNTGAGLYNVRGNLTRAVDAWFQGNVRAGVDNDDPTGFIDARNAYWGSATGPRTPLNPTGTGDRVEGNVFFAPFRTAPP